jgi:hypothetical protein
MTSEKALERKLKDVIRFNKGLYLKLLPFQFNGLPDRFCLLPGGVIFFAEIKTTGEKPKKLQTYVHKRIRSLGFKVFVIDTVEQIKEIAKLYESREL